MVAIQSIHLITSLVNCLSDISFTDTWKQMPDGNVPWSWKTAGYYNCILLCFWIKNRFFHDLVALFIVVYSNNNNSCAFWIPYHSQLWGCCNSVSLVRFHITMSWPYALALDNQWNQPFSLQFDYVDRHSNCLLLISYPNTYILCIWHMPIVCFCTAGLPTKALHAPKDI